MENRAGGLSTGLENSACEEWGNYIYLTNIIFSIINRLYK
jgi:hypothetical protein